MLYDFIEAELTTIPLEHWSAYFPVQVALMRYLERRYPDRIKFEAGGFDTEDPYLRGAGADWFVDDLWQGEELLDMVHVLLTGTLDDLKTRFPDGVDSPDSVKLDRALVEKIETYVNEEADAAANSGAF